MYVAFQVGGRQYRAVKGETLRIEKVPFQEGQVLKWTGEAFSDQGSHPVLVCAQPIEVRKEPKVLIFKKRRRHNSRRKNGHRQQLLWVTVTDIEKV